MSVKFILNSQPTVRIGTDDRAKYFGSKSTTPGPGTYSPPATGISLMHSII